MLLEVEIFAFAMVQLQEAPLVEELNESLDTSIRKFRRTKIGLGGLCVLVAAAVLFLVQPNIIRNGHGVHEAVQLHQDIDPECPVGYAPKLNFLDGEACVPVPRKTMSLASEWWYQNGTAVYIKPDGTVITAGSNVDSEMTPLPQGTKVVEVSAGGGFLLYLTQDKQVLAVGHNGIGPMLNQGQGSLGVGDNTSLNIVTPKAVLGLPADSSVHAIAAGFQHSLFLLEDGRVFGVGNTDFNQLGPTTGGATSPVLVFPKCTAIAASGSASFCLRQDGTVLMTGALNYYDAVFENGAPVLQYMVPTEVTRGLDKVHAIATTSNADSVLFIHVDGSVSGMGINSGGELGVGDQHARTVPTPIPCSVLKHVVAATIGTTWVLNDYWTYNGFALLMDEDGQIYGTGFNANNQMGSLLNSTSPTAIPELRGKRIVSFSAGSSDAAFLEEDGSLLVAGANTDGGLLISGQNVPFTQVPDIKVQLP